MPPNKNFLKNHVFEACVLAALIVLVSAGIYSGLFNFHNGKVLGLSTNETTEAEASSSPDFLVSTSTEDSLGNASGTNTSLLDTEVDDSNASGTEASLTNTTASTTTGSLSGTSTPINTESDTTESEQKQPEENQHSSVTMTVIPPELAEPSSACGELEQATQDNPELIVMERKGTVNPYEVRIRFKNVKYYLVKDSSLEMTLSNYEDFQDAVTKPFETVLDWTLPEGMTETAVYAKLSVSDECPAKMITSNLFEVKTK